MKHNLPINDVSQILAAVRDSLSEANAAHDRGGDVAWLIQSAFVRMRILLEALGLMEALKDVQEIEVAAKDNFAATEFSDEMGEEFLVWGGRLYQYIAALESALGEPKASIVTKDVIQILRGIQYSITDKNCFSSPPRK